MNAKNNHELSELFSAYLDGELSRADKARVEQWVYDDPSARRLLDELRTTIGLVSSLPRRAAPGSIAEDIELRLERHALLGDVPDPSVTPHRRWPLVRATLSVAAVLGLVVIAGLYIANDRSLDGPARTDRRSFAAPKESRSEGLASNKLVEKRLATRVTRRSGKDDRTNRKTSLSGTERVAIRKRTKSNRIPSMEQSPPASGRDGARPHVRSLGAIADGSESSAKPTDVVSLRTQTAGGESTGLLPKREAMILVVTVHSEQDSNALIQSLSARFADAVVEPTPSARVNRESRKIASPPARNAGSRRARRKRKTAAPPSSLTSKQVSLRVPLRSLATIVTDIDSRLDHAEISVQAGPLRVSGRERVGRLIDVLTYSAMEPEVNKAGAADDNKTGALAKPWRDLFTALGLDADVFVPSSEPGTSSGPLGASARNAENQPTGKTKRSGPQTDAARKASNAGVTQSVPSRSGGEGDVAARESKEKESRAYDAETKGGARSPLVARRMKALQRERSGDGAVKTVAKQSKATRRSAKADAGSRDSVTQSGPSASLDSGGKGESTTSSARRIIALIVRIDVDPSTGPAHTTATPVPKNAASGAKRAPVVEPSPAKKPPVKKERIKPAPKKDEDPDDTRPSSF